MKAGEIKKAVVLAAGFGTRLRPLTLVRPKPLLPVWGVPMLERILRMLESWGVEEIAVNAHWQAPQVRQFVATRKGRAKVTVAEEPEILGTGGVLNPLRYFLGVGPLGDRALPGGPFWLVNGDVVAEALDPQPIVDAFERSGRFAACWLSDTQGPRTVEADPEGRICNWKSDVPGDAGTYTYCGCALLSPQVLGYVVPSGFSTIVQAYEKAMMEDAKFVVGVMEDAKFVVGVTEEQAFWGDAGTLESYLEIHNALDPDRFEENPNVLFEGVKLVDTADLGGCVVTGGLVGGARSTRRVSRRLRTRSAGRVRTWRAASSARAAATAVSGGSSMATTVRSRSSTTTRSVRRTRATRLMRASSRRPACPCRACWRTCPRRRRLRLRTSTATRLRTARTGAAPTS